MCVAVLRHPSILNKILKFETSTSLHSVFIHNLYGVPTFLELGLYIHVNIFKIYTACVCIYIYIYIYIYILSTHTCIM